MEVYKHPRPESDSACACVCACHQHTLHKLNTEVIAASFLVTRTVTLSLSVLSLFLLENQSTPTKVASALFKSKCI